MVIQTGLSDKAQAVLTFFSAASIGVAASAVLVPVPEDVKPYWVMFFGLLGAIGFGVKEALGGQAPVAKA